MRNLTEQELKLAPDWATHYKFGISERNLIFINIEKLIAWNTNTPPSMAMVIHPDSVNLIFDAKRITKKPFDITKHKLGDTAWSINEVNADQGYIDFYNHETCTDDGDHESHSINKDDAIAIAKALGVTGEDLK